MASPQNGRAAGTHDKRNIWLLVITAVLIVASIFAFTPPQERINQGLDIQGGLSVVLTATSTDSDAITDEEMEQSRAIIESRVNALGASEAVVQVQGQNQILVQIPGMSDTETALATIGKTGKLEFARLDSFTDQEVVSKIKQGQYASEGVITDEFGNSFPSGELTHLMVEDGTYTPIVTGDNIERVTVDRASEGSAFYAVNLDLDDAGTAAFAEASRDLYPTQGQIVIILDNEVQSAPAVQGEIPNGNVSITGNYTLAEAQALQTVLESGSLPVSFSFSQSQAVGPTLGQNALATGILVALIGLVLVMVYLLFFYRGLGLITAAALVVMAVFYLGILAFLSIMGVFTLSLAGVAGIVLTIGMAADSSILTVERFREEIRMGRSVRAASITGVRHAIETSITADVVTLVSALVLFFLAAASVKGFGLTLALGIICDIVMMLLFKAPLVRLLAPKVIANNPSFWGITDNQRAAEVFGELGTAMNVSAGDAEIGLAMNAEIVENTVRQRASALADGILEKVNALKGRFIKHDINFMGHRRILLGICAALMIISFVGIGARGLNFGIEFVGGTSISFYDTGETTLDEMRTAFNNAGEDEAVIQTTFADGEEGFLVRTTTTDAQAAATTANQVATELGLSTDSFEVTTIGPDWGSSVIQASLIAFLVSIILIIVVIAIRFEYKMGLCAIVALLHDIILVVGVYALLGREITPNTIAALLTILGYSLYDTVVVFQRINDNMKDLDIKCTFMTMANHSLNQVFLRSLNTSITSLIPVLAMALFGGETLQDFAFPMVIGLIAGVFSSIALATPLFSIWKSRESRYAKLTDRFGSEVGLFEFMRAGGGPSASVASSKAARRKSEQARIAQVDQTFGEGAHQLLKGSESEEASESVQMSPEEMLEQATKSAQQHQSSTAYNDRARGGKRGKKKKRR